MGIKEYPKRLCRLGYPRFLSQTLSSNSSDSFGLGTKGQSPLVPILGVKGGEAPWGAEPPKN